MKSVNLIPAPRRDAKRRRRHHCICVAACGAYAIALACALGITQLAWRTNGEESFSYPAARSDNRHTHGTGCTTARADYGSRSGS